MAAAPATRTARTRGRVAVPLVLLIAVVATLRAGPVPFAVLAGVLLALTFLELRRLIGGAGSRASLVMGLVAVAAMTWMGATGRPEHLPWGMAGLLLSLLAGRVVMLETGHRGVEGATADIASTAAAVAVVGLTGAHVLLIRNSIGYEVTLLFVVVVAADALVAAAASRVVGRHRLSARVSTSRTWEGAAFGFAAALAAGLLLARLVELPLSTRGVVGMSAMLGLLAPVGDLASSAVQRSAGLEEDAGWLPGIGEVLNALDGALFAAPFFYWAVRTLVL
ncbi:MAG TPA: phosphatidate cytidylyltransferase [Actinomycetota bacterium]|nr:phosphatidate cytidylyltransferase [Actinomycetota bacterium]